MSVFVLTNPFISAGTTWTGTAPGDGNPTISGTLTDATSGGLSAYVTQVEVGVTQDMLEITNFASGGWKASTPGLKQGMLSLTLNQDYAASKVNAWFGLNGSVIPACGSGSYYIEVKPVNTTRSATNPSYVFQVYNNQWTPLTGKVGDLAVVTLQFAVVGKIGELTS